MAVKCEHRVRAHTWGPASWQGRILYKKEGLQLRLILPVSPPQPTRNSHQLERDREREREGRGNPREEERKATAMRRSSKKSASTAAAAGAEQVNEKQNRKRKGVRANLTSRKTKCGPTKAVSKEMERIDQLFYTYADSSSSMIDPEGIETLCSHLEVPHTDVRMLMLAWKMGSEKQGYFTLEEWRTGLKALRADSISKLKKAFPELVKEVTRPSNFQDFYPYAFRYCLTEDKKKCIEIAVACELLNLVLGLQFRPQVDELIEYLKYQNDYKVINMDQWTGFLRFCNEINFPSLDNYDPDLAWPLILDNFVEWLRGNQS